MKILKIYSKQITHFFASNSNFNSLHMLFIQLITGPMTPTVSHKLQDMDNFLSSPGNKMPPNDT